MDFNYIELIKTLGSLSSISSGYLNIRKAIVDNNRGQRDQSIDSIQPLTEEQKKSILTERIQTNYVNTEDRTALQTISPDILENATTRMKIARDRYVGVIMKGQIFEIEEERAITQREVCFFLSIILEHNKNRFPTNSSLEKVWQEFRCTLLHPQFNIRST